MLVKTVALNTANGTVEMPQSGFGVYQVKDPKECEETVLAALASGWRLIDTAASYGNEAAVGRAIAKSGIDRRELFITTKLWVEDASEKGAQRAVARSLELLGLDYLDLFLIHQPVGDVYGAWRTMTQLHRQGVLRAIGVSNFSPDRLVDFCLHQEVRPAVNQIEIHPLCQQVDALPYLQKYGVAAQAWAPFAEGRKNLFTNPVMEAIARKHSRTSAQVMLRWILERGASFVCKTTHVEHMQENLRVWDFALDEQDMAQIAALDTRTPQFVSHRDPKIVEWFSSRHIEH